MDLELNQSFDFGKGSKPRRNPACRFEIMQIGAVKLDEGYRQLDTVDLLVKPVLYKRVHPYVRKMTGLDPKALAAAEGFPKVYEQLLAFIGGEEYVFCVWGGSSDLRELYRNILHHRLDPGAVTWRYVDVQAIATQYIQAPKGMAIGLSAAVEKLDLPMSASFHNALHDAVYTADILRTLQNEARTLHTFDPDRQPARRPAPAGLNAALLFQDLEQDLNRKLSKKEKKLVRKVYGYGREKKFDVK
jgi:DNA polymerase III epsilon subunit-like protein